MLIHVTPQFLRCSRSGPHCDLIDVRIVELDMTLRNRVHLRADPSDAGNPLLTARRKVFEWPSEGIVVESPTQLERFRVVSRWAVQASMVLTHVVDYVVLDRDYDAVSDRMATWCATEPAFQGWASRVPPGLPVSNPEIRQPRMDATPLAPRQGEVMDQIRGGGWVFFRHEIFRMPTIEPERLLAALSAEARTPGANSAFADRHSSREPEHTPTTLEAA